VAFTQTEFESLLLDASKAINGDITWSEDDDGSPAVSFRVEVTSDPGYPIFMCGRYNPLAKTLSFALIHRQFGRLYALDFGKEHRNPDGVPVGEKHKHKYEEGFSDKKAYVPEDITAGTGDPIGVWIQFCGEAGIVHHGVMHKLPPRHEESFL
jgi:hypothetical protein